MKIERLEGIVPALFTPFKPNEEIDEGSLSSLINYLIEAGVHGLWVLGTSSEFSSLSIEERKRIYLFAFEEVNGRIPCVAAVSSSSTKVAVELAKYVEDIGYQGIAATPPYYLQSSPQSVFEHYRALSESVDAPLAVYDNSAATHHILSADLVADMNRKFGMKMIKLCGDPGKTPLNKAIKLKSILGDDINILIATAHFAYYAFSMGVAEGTISAVLNVIPEQFVRMYEAVKSGDQSTACEIQYRKILPLCFLSFSLETSETIAMVIGKTILKWLDVIEHETIRKPLGPLNDWQKKFLRSMVEYADII